MGLLAAIVELIDDLIADVTRIAGRVWQSPVPNLGFGFGAVIVGWLLLGHDEGGDFLSVAFWSENPEGMRNLLWSLATVAAGAAGLYGLSLAARRTKALDEQARIAEANRKLSEQAQITERFTRAVEQLGHKKRAVRLGAIYALERIAKDSGRDFETVIETLAAYVRQQSSVFDVPKWSEEIERDEKPIFPSSDISAAVLVVARAVPSEHALRKNKRIDFRYSDLRGLALQQADFSGFDFGNSDFSGACLEVHELVGASFRNCVLHGVDFTLADVSRANFEWAQNMNPDQLRWAYSEPDRPPSFLPANVMQPEYTARIEAFVKFEGEFSRQ